MSYNTALIEQLKKWTEDHATGCLDYQDLYAKTIERMKSHGIPKDGPEWTDVFSHAVFLATTVIAANVKKAEAMVDEATAKFEKTTGTPLDKKLFEMPLKELADLMDNLGPAKGTMTYKKVEAAFNVKFSAATKPPAVGHKHEWFHIEGKIHGCACGATKHGKSGADAILAIAPVGIGKETTDTVLKDEDTLFGVDANGNPMAEMWKSDPKAIEEPATLTKKGMLDAFNALKGHMWPPVTDELSEFDDKIYKDIQKIIVGSKVVKSADDQALKQGIAANVIANINDTKQKFVEFVETEILDVVGDLNLTQGGSITAHAKPGPATFVTLTISFDPKPDYIDGPGIVDRLAGSGCRITAMKFAEGSLLHTLQIEMERMPTYMSEPDMAEDALKYAKAVESAQYGAKQQCEDVDETFWGGLGVDVADKPVKTEEKKKHALFALNPAFYGMDWECVACNGSGGSGKGGPDGKETECPICHGFPTVSDLKKEFTEGQITIMQKMWSWDQAEETIQNTVQLGVDLAGGADATTIFHFMGKKIEVIPSGDVVPKTPNGKDSLLIVDGETYVGVNYHHEMKDKDGVETIHLKAQKIPVSQAVIEAVKKAGHIGLLGSAGAEAATDLDKEIMANTGPALAAKVAQEAYAAKALAKSMDDKAEEEFMKAIANPEATIQNAAKLFKEIMSVEVVDETEVTINPDGSVTPKQENSGKLGNSILMASAEKAEEYVPTDSKLQITSYGKSPYEIKKKTGDGKVQYYADNTMQEGDLVFMTSQTTVTSIPSSSQIISIGRACHTVLKGEKVWVKLGKTDITKLPVNPPKIYPPDVMVQVTSAEVDAAGLEIQTVIAGLSEMSFYRADTQTLFSFKCHELKFQFSTIISKGDWVQVRRVQNTDGSNTYLVERMNGKVMVELITSQQVMGDPLEETKKAATLTDMEVAQGAVKSRQLMASITFTSDMKSGEIMVAGGYACELSIMKQGQSIVASTSAEGGTKKIFDLALGCSEGVHVIGVFMHKTYKNRNVYTLRYDGADQVHYEDVPDPGLVMQPNPIVKGENALVTEAVPVAFSAGGRKLMELTKDGKIIVYADTYFAMNNKTVGKLADEFAKVFWQAIAAANPMAKQAQESQVKYITATKMIAKLQMIGNEKQGQIHTLAKELATIKAELAKPNHDQSKDPRKARFGNVASMLDLIEKQPETEL